MSFLFHVVVDSVERKASIKEWLMQYGVGSTQDYEDHFPNYFTYFSDDRNVAVLLSQQMGVMSVDYDNNMTLCSSRNINIPEYNWALDRICKRSATPNHSYEYQYTGKDVRVFLIDAGVLLSHREFKKVSDNNVLYDAYRNQYDSRFSYPDAVTPDIHGTHLASMITGRTVGVAPDAELASIRVFQNSKTSVPTSMIIPGIQHIIDVDSVSSKRSVVVMPFSGKKTRVWDYIIECLINRNFVVIVAGGNNNLHASRFSPSSAGTGFKIQKWIINYYRTSRKPIVVGATSNVIQTNTHSETLWNNGSQGSNWGESIDIMAPGHEVLGASISVSPQNSPVLANTSYYEKMSGTSVSCALIAGLAALYLESDNTLTHIAVQDKLIEKSTTGTIDQNVLSRLTKEFTESGTSLPFNSKTSNRIGYTWYIDHHVEWLDSANVVTLQNGQQILGHDLSVMSGEEKTLTLVALNKTASDERSVKYRLIVDDIPNGVTASLSERILVVDNLKGIYRVAADLHVKITDLLSTTQFVMTLQAYDETNPSIFSETLIAVTAKKKRTPPIFYSVTSNGVTTPITQSVVGLGNISPGVNINIKIDARDNDVGNISYFMVPSNGLPTGLFFDNNQIYGTVDSLEKDLLKHQFMIRAVGSSGLFTDCQFFFNVDQANLAHYWNETWLNGNVLLKTSPNNPSVRLIGLPSVSKGSVAQIPLSIVNPDNDTLVLDIKRPSDFQLIDLRIPSTAILGKIPLGLVIRNNQIYGVPQLSNEIGDYYFCINVRDNDDFNFEDRTSLIVFKITLSTNSTVQVKPLDDINWLTDSGNIGSIYEGYPSHISVAARNPTNQPISYNLAPFSKSLPIGITLDSRTGELRGLAPYVSAQENYDFTVRASLQNGQYRDRNFSFRVLNLPLGSKIMNVKATLDAYDKLDTKIQSYKGSVSVNEYVFRPGDANFGWNRNLHLFIAGGLNDTLDDEIIQQISDYHQKMKLRLGKLRSTIVRDVNQNHIYDVVWMEIIDPLEGAGGFDQLGVERSQFNNVPIKMDNTGKPIPGTTRYYPPSLKNARMDLIQVGNTRNSVNNGIGIQGVEPLPLWMTSRAVANDSLTTLGWTPGIVILYTRPGLGDVVRNNLILQGFHDEITGRDMTIDHYLIERFSENSMKLDTDTKFDATPEFMGPETRFDIKIVSVANNGKYYKFPPGDRV